MVGAGSHSKQQLDLVPLRHMRSDWKFDSDNAVRLSGAHGEEIVRSMCFDHGSDTIFTAGEDGKIRAWRTNGEGDVEASPAGGSKADGPMKKRKKGMKDDGDGKGRFRPY